MLFGRDAVSAGRWHAFVLVALVACPFIVTGNDLTPLEYGVDVSYPIHHYNVSTNYPWLPHNLDLTIETPEQYKDMVIQPLGDRQSFYSNMIQECVDYYGSKGDRCLENERQRVDMSLRQPASMVNYTKYGFTKIRAPDHVFSLIKQFWEDNRDKQSSENWSIGNIYTNHWTSPTYMLSVENAALKGGGYVLKQHIWNAARDTIQEWTGQQLAECSLYGIRIYTEGAVLAPHVDRLPLVSSAIINVDQDTDEPWPLEVIGHDGKAHNVTMEPGDLVLYESHSILHGRPFPLKGRFMANVFIHFEPIGPVGGEIPAGTTDLPPYLIPGSDEEPLWRNNNPNGHQIMGTRRVTTGSTEAHALAHEGNLDKLQVAIAAHEEAVNVKDANGWTPLHESIRSKDIEVVKFLVGKGSDVNARTGEDGQGGSTLWWAMNSLGPDHSIVHFLESIGAKNFAPDVSQEL